MNVILDISLLGSAHYYSRHRTGIARAIENLLDGLHGIDECHLSFCAYNNLEQYIQATAYLASHKMFGGNKMYAPGNALLRSIAGVAAMLYPDSLSDVSQRLRRRVISFFLKRLTALQDSQGSDVFNAADIFHATFYPLPNYVHSSSSLQRFITIYDMIPALFPEYFEPRINANFKNIMKSIHPDDWVVAISESTKNDLCNYLKFDPSRVFVTPLAASDLFYQCNDAARNSAVRSKYHIPEGPYILSICTLEPRKNIDHTIRCFIETIREQHIPDLQLVLVGTKGWDFDRIFDEITRDPEMHGRIVVTGYVPDEDLAPLYSGAMMFVYPSLYEGFGLPPLEAMQCGVPVITSNTSSLPEVVGNSGIMVSPTDKDALCQAFCDMYRDAKRRKIMSHMSLEQAKRFSWKQCAHDTVSAYKTALG